ncbi:CPBP family intramembrane glutamic endopeptidase [Butyrivibrio sp. WCD2001]|uniref:CPBP family intramembrane glutamic endopeptidase n=1 Tax=Butyrivibrio sp. WCD2001 TaxID=1280681 RepID=UPI00041C7E72|nr:CPBP family intramembrane glutamic endopeptidase [Butyrivibrio sp. WCD2001]
MSVKKKFSHLGFSILFYVVFSNILSVVVVAAAMFIYIFVNYFSYLSASPQTSDGLNMELYMQLIEQFRTNTTLTTLITMCSGYLIAVPISIIILNAPATRDLLPLKGMQFMTPEEKAQGRKLTPGEFFRFIMYMFPLGIIGSLIGQILAVIMGSITGQDMTDVLSSTLTNMSLPMVFLLSVVLAPIFEEIMFRYAVIGYCRRYGEWNAIIISAFIFGLIHTNVFQFFYAFALGIVFGYVYIYTRKLIYTIIMHCTFNFFGAFVPMLIDPNLSPSNTGSIIYSVIQYIVAIIGLIMLFFYVKKGSLLQNSPNTPIQDKFCKDSVLNVGMISLIIACIIITILLNFAI